LRRRILLVEGSVDKVRGLPAETLYKTLCTHESVHGFLVRTVPSTHATVAFLIALTSCIEREITARFSRSSARLQSGAWFEGPKFNDFSSVLEKTKPRSAAVQFGIKL